MLGRQSSCLLTVEPAFRIGRYHRFPFTQNQESLPSFLVWPTLSVVLCVCVFFPFFFLVQNIQALKNSDEWMARHHVWIPANQHVVLVSEDFFYPCRSVWERRVFFQCKRSHHIAELITARRGKNSLRGHDEELSRGNRSLREPRLFWWRTASDSEIMNHSSLNQSKDKLKAYWKDV